jgi:galactose mutarotase-like enzyme
MIEESGARITKRIDSGDVQALVVENELLRVRFLVDYGCDIVEFRFKPNDLDLLWHAPQGIRRRRHFVPCSPTDRPFLDYYHGGWQELFPHASSATTYAGAHLGFHGEVWGLPWDYEIVQNGPAHAAVRFWVRTIRMPFFLERTVSLAANEPVLRLHEKVVNEGKTDLCFMWGHHPAFGPPFLDKDSVLDAGARTIRVGERLHKWPVDAAGVDHRRLMPEPGTGSEIMKYLLDFREGWVSLAQPKLQLGLALVFDPAVFNCVWLWQEFEYTREYPWFGRAYVLGVEPQSSLPGAHESGGRLLGLQAGEELETDLLAVVYSGTRVNHISRNGQVALA